MISRRGTAGFVAAFAAASLAVGIPTASAQAPAPAGSEILLGTWAWRDLDEALVNLVNPRTVVFSVQNGAIRGRFGQKRPFSVRWTPESQRVVFTTRRWTGRSTVRVRYSGRVSGAAARPTMRGESRIFSRRFAGDGAFTAFRTRAAV